MNDAVETYINAHSKSQVSGFFLTLILGPLGFFYSSWVAALILCVIVIASAASTSYIGPIICWLLSMMISFSAVSRHNDKVRATANLARQKSSVVE